MKVTVNGKSSETWSASDALGVSLPKSMREAVGEVLEIGPASRSYRAEALRDFVVHSGLGVALGAAIFLGGLALVDSREHLTIAISAALPAISVALAARWQYRRDVAKWNRRVAGRMEGLPAAGTPILVDDEGVRVGRDKYFWTIMTPVALELIERSNENESVWVAERIVVEASGRTLAFDRALMRNGGEIVDAAYARLVRERARLEVARAAASRAPQSAFSAARPA